MGRYNHKRESSQVELTIDAITPDGLAQRVVVGRFPNGDAELVISNNSQTENQTIYVAIPATEGERFATEVYRLFKK